MLSPAAHVSSMCLSLNPIHLKKEDQVSKALDACQIVVPSEIFAIAKYTINKHKFFAT